MTGINPLSILSLITLRATSVGSPTKPKSKIFSILESLSFNSILSFFACIRLFSFPDRPTAFPPVALMSSTILLFMSFDNTSSTIFVLPLC